VRFERKSSISLLEGRMTSPPEPPLITMVDRVIKTFAAWALLCSFLEEHPPAKELTVGFQKKWIRVLLKSESWMIAQFLARRAWTTNDPWGLCQLAKVLVGRDGDRNKAARDALRDRYLPAFEAYELVQVTRAADGRFAIAATDKLLTFLSDRYFPAALKSNDDEWLETAAKEGELSDENEGELSDENEGDHSNEV
jgi:hypothetical protein